MPPRSKDVFLEADDSALYYYADDAPPPPPPPPVAAGMTQQHQPPPQVIQNQDNNVNNMMMNHPALPPLAIPPPPPQQPQQQLQQLQQQLPHPDLHEEEDDDHFSVLEEDEHHPDTDDDDDDHDDDSHILMMAEQHAQEQENAEQDDNSEYDDEQMMLIHPSATFQYDDDDDDDDHDEEEDEDQDLDAQGQSYTANNNMIWRSSSGTDTTTPPIYSPSALASSPPPPPPPPPAPTNATTVRGNNNHVFLFDTPSSSNTATGPSANRPVITSLNTPSGLTPPSLLSGTRNNRHLRPAAASPHWVTPPPASSSTAASWNNQHHHRGVHPMRVLSLRPRPTVSSQLPSAHRPHFASNNNVTITVPPVVDLAWVQRLFANNNILDNLRLRPEQHCDVLNQLLELGYQQQKQQSSKDGDSLAASQLSVVLLQWLTEQARQPSQLHLFCESPPSSLTSLHHANSKAGTSSVLSQVTRLLHIPGPAQEGAAEVIRTLTAHEVMDPYLMSASYNDKRDASSANGPAIQEEDQGPDDEAQEEQALQPQLNNEMSIVARTKKSFMNLKLRPRQRRPSPLLLAQQQEYDLLCVLAHVAQDNVAASPQARIHSGIAIMNLSCGQANKARMAQCPQILQAMKSILYEQVPSMHAQDCRQDLQETKPHNLLETLQLKATTTLKNLSNLDTNDVALISCPDLVHALGHVILKTTLRGRGTLVSHGAASGPTPSTTNACMALMNLSISKQYKSQIYHTPGVMQALLTVLAQTSILNMPTLLSPTAPQLSEEEEGLMWQTNGHKSLLTSSLSSTKSSAAKITALNSTAQEARIRACSVLSNLAIGYDNKISMFIYPGFVEAILVMIRTDEGEARSKACSILWSLAAEMENQVPMVHERGDILPVLIEVASDHTSINQEARQKCVACLTLLAESPHNAMALLEAGVLQPLFEILNQAGSDPTHWKDHTASWCVSCIMNLAQVDMAVPTLRQGGAVELLAPLVVLDQHYQSLKAAMAVTLCCRLDQDFLRQPQAGTANYAVLSSSSSSCYYNLLRKTETAIPKIVNLLHNTLAGRGGEGYKFGVFTLSSSVACIAALASGPEFLQEHICTTPVLVSLLQVLWDFSVDGGVPGCIVGGGRDDFASATWAVKAIHSIVTYLLALGEDGSCAYGETFLQPSLVDPLVCALRSVEQRLLQPQSPTRTQNNESQFDNKEICSLASKARQLISSAAIHEQQRHHDSRRRRRRLNTADGADDESDCQSRCSTSSSSSSGEGPFVIRQSFVMTPHQIPAALTETSATSAMDTTLGSEATAYEPGSPKMASPTLSPSSQTGYETPASPSSPVATRTAIRTFLLSDACSGRRFVVPTDPQASQTTTSPEEADNGDHHTSCQRPPRLWCFRRGRFCQPHEVPDPNYIWTPQLQRAYEMALDRAKAHKQHDM